MRIYRNPLGYDFDHETAASTLTADIIDGGNVVVDAALSATVADGVATVHVGSLPAFDIYEIRWSDGASDFVELVERPYFTLAEFRAYQTGAKMSSSISDDQLSETRAQVEDVFDDSAGHPFCLRGQRETIYGNGRNTYQLSACDVSEIVSCLVDGVSVSCSLFGTMHVHLPSPVYPGSIICVHYTHGDRRPAGALKHNALVYANSLIGAPSVNPRATGMQNELGYMKFSVAGRDGATGIPEVDAFLSGDPTKGGHGYGGVMII
jgi:hypothetical protein